MRRLMLQASLPLPVKPAVRIAQISLEDDSLAGPSTKRPRVDDSAETVWLKLDKHILTSDDKLSLTGGLQLNDHHINYTQVLLKRQFPTAGGLLLTLLQNSAVKDKIMCGLQIIHCVERNHWIVASRLDSCHSPIRIYDSLYKSVHSETNAVISNLFKKIGKMRIDVKEMRVQRGGADCGVFAIAVATSLLFGLDPSKANYQQEKMREHLL